MRRAIALVLTACALGSCASDAKPQREEKRSHAYVVRSGFSVRGDRIGVGALVRVRGDRPIREIRLRVSYYVGDRRVGAEPDTLRYCAPGTDCFWGQSFFSGGDIPRSVDRVVVDVSGDRGAYKRRAQIEELDVRVEGDEVEVQPAGEEGTLYVIAFRGRTPRFGLSYFLTSADRTTLRYSQNLFPRAQGDRVRAFIYRGSVPASVGGPAD
jgi:hypothetical protein